MGDEDIFWDDGIPPVTPLQKGSKLFINDDERADFDKANVIAYFGIKRGHFLSYAIQYKQAADRLIQTIDSLPDRETCVLPIIFLYRHYIELQLKSILEHEGNKIPKDHRLNALWKQVKPILERILKQLSRKELLAEMEAAEERIMEFYEVDELSDSFRYPIDTKGKPTLKNNRLLQSIDYIDLQHIAKEMASLDAFLCNAEMLHLISQGNPNHLSQNATP